MTNDIDWPAYFVDEDGEEHDWEEPYPTEDPDPDPDMPVYTYRDLVTDQANAQGLHIEEYLETTGHTHEDEDLDEEDDYDLD